MTPVHAYGPPSHDPDRRASENQTWIGWVPVQGILLVIVVLSAVGVRFAALVSTIGRSDADESITGIMA